MEIKVKGMYHTEHTEMAASAPPEPALTDGSEVEESKREERRVTCNDVALPQGALGIGRGSGRVSMVLRDRNELANYMLGKQGSLSLSLVCHPLRFRNVSFECPMAQTGSTVSVRVWAVMTNRVTGSPEETSVGNHHKATPKGR